MENFGKKKFSSGDEFFFQIFFRLNFRFFMINGNFINKLRYFIIMIIIFYDYEVPNLMIVNYHFRFTISKLNTFWCQKIIIIMIKYLSLLMKFPFIIKKLKFSRKKFRKKNSSPDENFFFPKFSIFFNKRLVRVKTKLFSHYSF